MEEQNMKILIVEDDKIIASGIEYSLKQEQFEVMIAYTVKEAKEVLKQTSIDLCLLDLSLPDGTGYEVCQCAKKAGDIPVIFLTAVDDEGNIVMGLDMGADDYITKPFRIRELISRIKSVLRRYNKEKKEEAIIRLQDVEVRLSEGKVYKNHHEVILTAMEYRLFLTLLQNRGQILSRNQLLEGIWDVSGEFVNDNTLTVYIKRLREKLENNPSSPELIKTVRGLGYLLEKGV